MTERSTLFSPPVHLKEVNVKLDQGNNPCFVFPPIKTTRTMDERVQKILDEIKEFQEAEGEDKDKEAVDIMHAVETFLRGQFHGREFRLNGVISETYRKNKNRGYYDDECF